MQASVGFNAPPIPRRRARDESRRDDEQPSVGDPATERRVRRCIIAAGLLLAVAFPLTLGFAVWMTFGAVPALVVVAIVVCVELQFLGETVF